MFMLVSRRYERASLIVTSNKPFSEDILAFYVFPLTTGARSEAPTRWSASTARSPGAPTSSGSSPRTKG
jgi:hypothetical protein